MRRLADCAHLARRFLASLSNAPPDLAEEAWARTWLTPLEATLWQSQPGRDRRHTLAVARLVEGAVEGQTETAQADTAWLVAAGLLHDVGKTSAQLGVIGRSAATVLELLGVGSAPGRLGRYLHYPVAGAAALQRAGSDPRVVAWAGEHHLGAARWTVPASAGELLARADRDA